MIDREGTVRLCGPVTVPGGPKLDFPPSVFLVHDTAGGEDAGFAGTGHLDDHGTTFLLKTDFSEQNTRLPGDGPPVCNAAHSNHRREYQPKEDLAASAQGSACRLVNSDALLVGNLPTFFIIASRPPFPHCTHCGFIVV